MSTQKAEQLRPGGEGVQFSPFGFVALDQAIPVEASALAGAAPPARIEQEPPTSMARVDRPIARVPVAAPLAPSPRGVIKAAKARIKELRAFLKEAKRAEKELRELERLVAAAKKPLAAVRDIRRSAG